MKIEAVTFVAIEPTPKAVEGAAFDEAMTAVENESVAADEVRTDREAKERSTKKERSVDPSQLANVLLPADVCGRPENASPADEDCGRASANGVANAFGRARYATGASAHDADARRSSATGGVSVKAAAVPSSFAAKNAGGSDGGRASATGAANAFGRAENAGRDDRGVGGANGVRDVDGDRASATRDVSVSAAAVPSSFAAKNAGGSDGGRASATGVASASDAGVNGVANAFGRARNARAANANDADDRRASATRDVSMSAAAVPSSFAAKNTRGSDGGRSSATAVPPAGDAGVNGVANAFGRARNARAASANDADDRRASAIGVANAVGGAENAGRDGRGVGRVNGARGVDGDRARADGSFVDESSDAPLTGDVDASVDVERLINAMDASPLHTSHVDAPREERSVNVSTVVNAPTMTRDPDTIVRAAESTMHKRVLTETKATATVTLPELGRIDVEAHAATHEKPIFVHVRADHVTTIELLANHATELQTDIREAVPAAQVAIERGFAQNDHDSREQRQHERRDADDDVREAPRAFRRAARFVL